MLKKRLTCSLRVNWWKRCPVESGRRFSVGKEKWTSSWGRVIFRRGSECMWGHSRKPEQHSAINYNYLPAQLNSARLHHWES
jgi:hypothetical protein